MAVAIEVSSGDQGPTGHDVRDRERGGAQKGIADRAAQIPIKNLSSRVVLPYEVRHAVAVEIAINDRAQQHGQITESIIDGEIRPAVAVEIGNGEGTGG